MKSRSKFLVGTIAVALVAAFAVFRILPMIQKEETAVVPATKGSPAGGGAAALPVYTERVTSRTLEQRITATGSVSAEESIDLVSELSGKAVWVGFEEGSRVKQGEVLLKLDDTELRAEVARADTRIGLARAQAERQAALIKGGGTSRESYETAMNEVRVLEAELTLVAARLAKAEIRAPFDGIVGLRYVSAGAYVTPQTRIATLQNTDTIKVEFAIAERHLERVRNDAEVTIAIAGISDPFVGRVYAIEPRIDEATRTLRLRARADNPGGRALPGGFATVEMGLREIPNALLVPATALVAGLNEQQVYVLEQGRAQPRKVQIGLRLARQVQILSGLEPGAVVITSGQMQLRPGMAVEAVATPTTTPEAEPIDAKTDTPVRSKNTVTRMETP